MTEQTFRSNYNKRIAAELREADDLVVKRQLELDYWWQAQRDLEFEEDDVYEVGGFMEKWSQTASYTKGKRDSDWRVR